MASKPTPTLRHDGIALVIGALFAAVGVSAVHDSVGDVAFPSNWIFGVCCILFGGMIVGVAINHISVGRRTRKLNDVKGGNK